MIGTSRTDFRMLGMAGAAALATMIPSAMAHASTEADISTLLKARTEAFSDAGQRGDGKAMAASLDDRVVFFNEGGDGASKADMASSTPSAPNGVSTTMTIMDWKCELHGDVAVASFIDDQQQDYHGQPFRAKYRSVETWLKENGEWRMIGSATIALQDDPASIALAPALLDQYVGTYEAAPGVSITFVRKGDMLLASANGGPEIAQKIEVRDVLFTPGRSRQRKIFERDATGRVTGYLLRR